MHDVDNDELTIDLGELFSVLWNKIYIIILAGIVLAFAAFAYTQLLITPKYTSTTSMYMLTKTEGSTGLTTSDLQTGTQLTQDYMELTKSRTVLEKVISTLNLDMTVEELNSSVTTANTENTRIMTIEVENEDPELARDIADTLREAASNKIEEIMNIDAVNTIEDANLPTSPSSPSVMKNTAIGAILGILISAGIIILLFMMDDTIKTPEDVEKYLYTSVKNQALQYIRRDKTLDNEYLELYQIEAIPVSDDPEKQLLQQEYLNLIQQAIYSLPEKCREVFRLVQQGDLKHREIASLLGISEKTVEAHVANAYRRIAQYVNHEYSRSEKRLHLILLFF